MTNGGTYRYQNDEYNHQVGLDIEPIKNWVTHAIFNYRTSHMRVIQICSINLSV